MRPGPWFMLTALSPLLVVVATAILVLSLTRERAEQAQRRAASVDPLTGLWNRRVLFERGQRLLTRAARAGTPVSLLVFDLDRFKDINDRYGHPVGDRVLRAFADVLTTTLRANDICGRVGGEEFIAVLPGADAAMAHSAADRVRSALTGTVIAGDTCRVAVTVSVGVSTKPDGVDDFEHMVLLADRALYSAKAGGRDRVHAMDMAMA